jgi:hypothetical protein
MRGATNASQKGGERFRDECKLFRPRATPTLYSNFIRSNLMRRLGPGTEENGSGAVRSKIHYRVASNKNHARRSASSIQISIKLVVA